MSTEATTSPEVTEVTTGNSSLSTAAARNLATTTKSVPQMQGITSRWLLRKLPWVEAQGGAYRVNRRLTYAVGRGRVAFVRTGAETTVFAPSLREVPALRGFGDDALLADLASRFTQRDFAPGDVLFEAGQPITEVFLIAHGKVSKIGTGKYGEPTTLGGLADGDHLGDEAVLLPEAIWPYSVRATTAGTAMALEFAIFQQMMDRSPELRAQIEQFVADASLPTNRKGEADIALAAGHVGEPELPATFADYELSPREYELSVTQTVLRVHTRVTDLYNQPMNQFEQQLRLTVHALRERQEYEMINNREFGLLHNAAHDQRFQTRSGPPTPDDLDELITRRSSTRVMLAHPRTIATFGRECSGRGVYPDTVVEDGEFITAWRGIPIYPCDKIPITDGQTSSILAMRIGEDNRGVIGLHQTGIPDEIEPSLNVRFMGIDEKSVQSFLVSAYYSAAILVPDALGILENVEVS